MKQLDVSLRVDQDGGVVWGRSDVVSAREDVTVHVPKKFSSAKRKGLLSPSQIYAQLSEYVVGQDEAKVALSVAVYNHFTHVLMSDSLKDSGTELSKSNVLMLGPTGSGKTLVAQTLARVMKVPFAIADATTLTEAGYVGEDVESVLRKLLEASGRDVKLAEKGIIYIDEIDKIASANPRGVRGRDASGEGVQQGLLKILEGTEASVSMDSGPKKSQSECYKVNTSNILFILGGAFPGLSDIVAKRVHKISVGFNSQLAVYGEQRESELLAQVTPEDLNAFGMLPEFVGRVPVITSLAALTEDDLFRVQTEPKNAVARQFEVQFALEGRRLVVTDKARRAIAREALQRETGARGLRSIYERVLRRAMFEVPDQTGPTAVVVSESDVLGETSPEIRRCSSSDIDAVDYEAPAAVVC